MGEDEGIFQERLISKGLDMSHVDKIVALANKPGDGQRNVASIKGVKKYNKPMGAPLGTGGAYKGRSAMGQLKQVSGFDDNDAEARLANFEVAHGYVTQANPGDQVVVTSKSGKTVTYTKQSGGGWKSEAGIRTDEHLIDLVNHDLVAKWNFKEDPVKAEAAEKAKNEAMWAKVTDDQLQKMIASYENVIKSGKYSANDNAGLQKMIDAARAELTKRESNKLAGKNLQSTLEGKLPASSKGLGSMPSEGQGWGDPALELKRREEEVTKAYTEYEKLIGALSEASASEEKALKKKMAAALARLNTAQAKLKVFKEYNG